jgi:hypothetical protein
MRSFIIAAALLVAGAAQAQTYQFGVGDGQPGFGFGGSFTFNNGTFSNLNITDSQGATFDLSASGGLDGSSSTLSSYIFYGASGNVGLDATAPFGTPGLLIENAYEDAPGVPPPGFCEGEIQNAPGCSASISVVSKTTAAPEINPGVVVSALTLLLGALAILRGKRSLSHCSLDAPGRGILGIGRDRRRIVSCKPLELCDHELVSETRPIELLHETAMAAVAGAQRG